jgi:hypothetical protein
LRALYESYHTSAHPPERGPGNHCLYKIFGVRFVKGTKTALSFAFVMGFPALENPSPGSGGEPNFGIPLGDTQDE